MSDLHGLGMFLVWLVPLLLAGAVGYYIKGAKNKSPSARDILDERYANDEIDSDEYHKKLKELKVKQ